MAFFYSKTIGMGGAKTATGTKKTGIMNRLMSEYGDIEVDFMYNENSDSVAYRITLFDHESGRMLKDIDSGNIPNPAKKMNNKINSRYSKHTIKANAPKTFIDGYIQAILFTETDGRDPEHGGGDPLDNNFTSRNFNSDSMKLIEKECNDFYSKIESILEAAKEEGYYPDDDQLGIDFWLSRNGHGTGFWDREDIYGEKAAEELDKIAESFREAHVYPIIDEGFDWENPDIDYDEIELEYFTERRITNAGKKYYIGERYNPQLSNSYFIAYGELTKTEVKNKESTVYGSMSLTEYATEESYKEALEELEAKGYKIRYK